MSVPSVSLPGTLLSEVQGQEAKEGNVRSTKSSFAVAPPAPEDPLTVAHAKVHISYYIHYIYMNKSIFIDMIYLMINYIILGINLYSCQC